MKRLLLGLAVVLALGTAVVVSGSKDGTPRTDFPSEKRNPVTHLRWNQSAGEFQFALVSDRTGGHRANVFAQAVEKLNLLQPAFVLSVGDLIEGAKEQAKLEAQWKEFDGYVNRLTMPFFYVPGNHDTALPESAKFWEAKLGRRHYHFVYQNVLFLVLNTDDPPGSGGAIGKEQAEFARRVLAENAGVRWTVVALHRPLWVANNGEKNGWRDVEKALAGRPYTVFAGHVHRYEKFVRQGMNYYQLATTGGSSLLRGVEAREFDQVVWVTMKKDGPLFANLQLDAIQSEDLRPPQVSEKGSSPANRRKTYPVIGRAFFEGAPMVGAQVVLSATDGGTAKGSRAVGKVAADGNFHLSTYKADDGAPAGEYHVSVTWRDPTTKGAPSLLPERYTTAAKSGLKATIRAGENELVLELKK